MPRRLLLALFAVVLACAPLWSQDKAKDPPFVKATRKKLLSKVTVDYKDTPLIEVRKDLEGQVENLSIRIDPTVSQNLPLTYKAQDKPLVDVFRGMLNAKNGLGYVISRKNDRYRGWVIIRQSKEQGDEISQETVEGKGHKKGKAKAEKTAAKEKPATKEKPEGKEPADDPDRAEHDAARKLGFAKALADAGKVERARQRLDEIVSKYPDTKAAAQAKDLLKDLKDK